MNDAQRDVPVEPEAAPARRYYTMLIRNPNTRKLIGFYGVIATDEDDAREQIATRMAHRPKIVEEWIADGRPVRASQPRVRR